MSSLGVQKKVIIFFLGTVVLLPSFSNAAFLSGGTYRVHNPQVNPIIGTYSGGGITTFSGGRPISGISSGGGIQNQQGTPYNNLSVTPDTGGGSTGGSIILRITSTNTTSVTTTTATILFISNRAAYSNLSYAPSGGSYTTLPLTTTLATTHAVTLTGLTPCTVYSYIPYVEEGVQSDDAGPYSFMTLCIPVPPTPVPPITPGGTPTPTPTPGTGTVIEFEDGESVEIFYAIEVTVPEIYKTLTTTVFVPEFTLYDLTSNDTLEKVTVMYQIINKETGEVILETSDVRNLRRELTYTKAFTLPGDLDPTDYEIVATLLYTGGSANSSDTFRVVLGGIAGGMCLVGGVTYWWWIILLLIVVLIDTIITFGKRIHSKASLESLLKYSKKRYNIRR